MSMEVPREQLDKPTTSENQGSGRTDIKKVLDSQLRDPQEPDKTDSGDSQGISFPPRGDLEAWLLSFQIPNGVREIPQRSGLASTELTPPINRNLIRRFPLRLTPRGKFGGVSEEQLLGIDPHQYGWNNVVELLLHQSNLLEATRFLRHVRQKDRPQSGSSLVDTKYKREVGNIVEYWRKRNIL